MINDPCGNEDSYEVGACLRREILKNGLKEGALLQIKQIINNHGTEILIDFFRGLLDGKSSN